MNTKIFEAPSFFLFAELHYFSMPKQQHWLKNYLNQLIISLINSHQHDLGIGTSGIASNSFKSIFPSPLESILSKNSLISLLVGMSLPCISIKDLTFFLNSFLEIWPSSFLSNFSKSSPKSLVDLSTAEKNS